MTQTGKHILLIDDDTDMHEVVRLMLEPLGYRVSCCTTASGGFDRLRSDKPDLLLLDIMLSTPTEGFEIAAEIKEDRSLRDIPIVMVSSTPRQIEPDPVTGQRPDIDRAARFLEKPLDAKVLRSTIEDVLHAIEERRR